MNTNNTMLNMDKATIDMIDLSVDKPQERPMMKKLVAVNPLIRKSSSPPMAEHPYSRLENPFGGNQRSRIGSTCNASPSTFQGPGDLDGSSKSNTKLDYFDDDSDDAPNITTSRKRQGRSQANAIGSSSGDDTTNSKAAAAGVKKRKFDADHSHKGRQAAVDRFPRASSPSLFMSPAPNLSKVRLAALTHVNTFWRTSLTKLQTQTQGGAPRKARQGRLNFQPPPSFGSQVRNIATGTLPTPTARLAPPTGIAHIDIAASMRYMEGQIRRTSTEIVQPVIDLTRTVQQLQQQLHSLQLDNAKLRDQMYGDQEAVKKSISDVHERQNEHEELIDRLSTSTISPAGTAYGGPRNTAAKKPGLFQGMLSG